jgi:hypothetical protein
MRQKQYCQKTVPNSTLIQSQILWPFGSQLLIPGKEHLTKHGKGLNLNQFSSCKHIHDIDGHTASGNKPTSAAQ